MRVTLGMLEIISWSIFPLELVGRGHSLWLLKVVTKLHRKGGRESKVT